MTSTATYLFINERMKQSKEPPKIGKHRPTPLSFLILKRLTYISKRLLSELTNRRKRCGRQTYAVIRPMRETELSLILATATNYFILAGKVHHLFVAHLCISIRTIFWPVLDSCWPLYTLYSCPEADDAAINVPTVLLLPCLMAGQSLAQFHCYRNLWKLRLVRRCVS